MPGVFIYSEDSIEYEKGFKIDELFPILSSEIKKDDALNIVSFIKTSHFNYRFHYRIFDDRFTDNHQEKGVLDNYPVIRDLISTRNLNPEIVNHISSRLSLTFTNEKEIPLEGEVCFINSVEVRPEFRLTFAPIDILDYIYAVLHSPSYREKYKEFLKIDFPRVSYPTDNATFWKLVALGGELRQIHLLECLVVEKYITQYPIDGNNMVEKIKYQDNKVFINEKQYFDQVPQIAWEFNIGGYQPAQKWLKDRKGRELDFGEILHYQKIIVALMVTDSIMEEIDKIKID